MDLKKRLESDFDKLVVLKGFQEMFKINRDLAGTFFKTVEGMLDFKDISVKKYLCTGSLILHIVLKTGI